MSCAHFCVGADEAPEAVNEALFSLPIEEAALNQPLDNRSRYVLMPEKESAGGA
jgi:hypothetical protein